MRADGGIGVPAVAIQERMNACQGRGRLGETFNKPLTDFFACPVFTWAEKRHNFSRLTHLIRHINAQGPGPGFARFRTGVANPDVLLESDAHIGRT